MSPWTTWKIPLGHPGFEEQLGQADGNRRVAFAGLQDEGIANRSGDRAHPQRNHRGKVERRDADADAERLAHRIDVDTGAGALCIFALQHMRDAATEFDDLQPALDVALGIGDYLAMFGREHLGKLVHIGLYQPLIFEHHPRAPLGIHCGPGRLRRLGRRDRAIEERLVAKRHLRLNAAIVRIEHVAEPSRIAAGTADDVMIDLSHEGRVSRF